MVYISVPERCNPKRYASSVIRNTMADVRLGLITQWIPMAFAIFLCEIKNLTFRRFVQTFTTIT